VTAPRLNSGADGVRQPFQAAYGGILYPGEVVFTRRWDARLGRVLEGECYFRVVFLRSAREVAVASLEDGRIAVCAYGRGVSASRTATQDAARFHGGRLLCKVDLGLSLSDAFSGAGPEAWATIIASAVLASTYPVPPVYASLVKAPLQPEDAGRVFAALSASGDLQRGALRELGPALGFCDPEHPNVFDPLRCRAFDVIRLMLAERQTLPWAEAHRRLAHGLGLTGPYATLCLLTFVCHSRPDVELLLVPGHTLRLRRRSRLLGDRLTRELAPLLEWRADLSRDVSALVRPRDVAWNAALPYAALLRRDFVPVALESGSGPQAQRLMAALASLAQDIRLAEAALPVLSEGALGFPHEQAGGCIARLRPVAESGDLRSFLARAREQFRSPDEMAGDLASLQRILSLRPRLQPLAGKRGDPEGR